MIASDSVGLQKQAPRSNPRRRRITFARVRRRKEKKELLDRLLKPSGVSDEERMKRAAAIIRRAVSNGLVEVEVFRFSNKLCTDSGRAINQQEPGWEETLTGLPKELFLFWKKHLPRAAIA
jgi:hypothetical protein